MPEYILTKGSIGGLVLDSGDSVDVKRGDKVQLSEEKARRFKWLKPTKAITVSKRELSDTLDAAIVAQQSLDIEKSTDVDWSRYRDMKAPDLIAEIKDTDSLDDLMELKKVEEGGQNRIGVLKEIEKRVRQLEEEK